MRKVSNSSYELGTKGVCAAYTLILERPESMS